MKHLLLRGTLSTLATLGGVLTPMVAAAAPAAVSDIEAYLDAAGQIVVEWEEPASSEAITSYRVFYSSESILVNNGLYDDFETSPSPETRYVFDTRPPADVLYVSLLAIDAAGEESPFFVDEASVQLSESAMTEMDIMEPETDDDVMLASSAAAMQDSVLRILRGSVESSTGIVLEMNQPLLEEIDQNQSLLSAFSMLVGSGSSPSIVRVVPNGTMVHIHTNRDLPTTGVLLVRMESGLMGGANGQATGISQEQTLLLPLNPSSSSSRVSSSQQSSIARTSVSSSARSVAQPSSVVPGARTDIRNLELQAVAEGSSYTVTATWTLAPHADIDSVLVAQSQDRGTTFQTPHRITADQTAIRIRNVPGGTLGLSVQVGYVDGSLSEGMFEMIRLSDDVVPAASSQTSSQAPQSSSDEYQAPVQGDLTGGGKGGTLTASGLAAVIPMMLAGGTAGWTIVRRRRKFAA